MKASLLDVRPQNAFEAGHARGAANIPLEELSARVHELPETGGPLAVFDVDPDRTNQAIRFLIDRGHLASASAIGEVQLNQAGASTTHLWRPNAFLVEALKLIKAAAPLRALDLACGTGRDAVYLALQGHRVEAIDLLPDAIGRVNDFARRAGVPVTTQVQDLQKNRALPRAAYDLVTVFRYLQRDLFPTIRRAIAPGGFVVYETFHLRNRETGRRPLNPDHLLHDGELRRAFDGFEILIDRDAVERGGRYFSSFLARAADCRAGFIPPILSPNEQTAG